MSQRSDADAARRATITLGAAIALLFGVGCQGDETAAPSEIRNKPSLEVASAALTFRQISAGGFHNCGVTPENVGYCWGANFSHQLGDGTETRRLAPLLIDGFEFRSISAGEYHTCGVTTDYRVYCWGNNSAGELGDGSTVGRATPVAVLGGLHFRQVETAGNVTCALTQVDRRAYCWGSNNFGQLGDGTRINRTSPVPVAGGRVFRQVSTGRLHVCAVTPTDRAFCWGRNNYGQLGDGTGLLRTRPALVAGSLPFRQVDAGAAHTCGVTTANQAFCWGYGGSGEIGDGKTLLRLSPRAVAGGLSFSRVSTGVAFSCGETTANRGYCWGANPHGQLGDGTTLYRPTPGAVTGGLSFVLLSAASGGSHACGMNRAGLAYCWGSNSEGELGDGTTTQRLEPVAVIGPT